MHSGQTPAAVDGKVPIFIFPTSLTFYADDQSTHKQILTLYNPYEFPLKFKVLSTSPRKYVVVDSEGTIRPRCCLDIVIRHAAISAAAYGTVDKFRIQMHEHGQRQMMGRKDVAAVLLPSRPDASANVSADNEEFEQLPSLQSQAHATRGQQYSIGGVAERNTHGPNFFFILVAIVCIVALTLPTDGQVNSEFPSYFHLTLHQKLIFAYALGLVTMAILRT